MPGLRGKDIPPGAYARPTRVSTTVCPGCGTPLHVYAVAAGWRWHPTCQKEPR